MSAISTWFILFLDEKKKRALSRGIVWDREKYSKLRIPPPTLKLRVITEECSGAKFTVPLHLPGRIPVTWRIISLIPLQCDHYAPVMTVHSGTRRTAPPAFPRICLGSATMGARCTTLRSLGRYAITHPEDWRFNCKKKIFRLCSNHLFPQFCRWDIFILTQRRWKGRVKSIDNPMLNSTM